MSGQRRVLGGWGQVGLVAGREIRERVRARSFQVSTGLLVLVIVALGVIVRVGVGDGPGALRVAVVDADGGALEQALVAAGERSDREVDPVIVPDGSTARRVVDDGDADLAVLAEDRQVLFADEVDEQALSIVRQAWAALDLRDALVGHGLEESEVAEALSARPIEATTLSGGDGDDGLAILVGTLAAILLFITLQTFGTYVLTGVVEEKSTAVVEVLLVRVPARHLLAGKVIGIGVAALIQLVLAVTAGMVSLALASVSVPGEVWSALPMVLVWFLGGYALYSTLFALAGSLVSRQEDAQAAAAPIMTVLIGAYLLVFFFGYAPESTASRVMSVIPPLAPLLMPMRMAAGAASVLEVGLALVLMVAGVVLAWQLAGRIYNQVLLQRGTRISWRAAGAFLRGD